MLGDFYIQLSEFYNQKKWSTHPLFSPYPISCRGSGGGGGRQRETEIAEELQREISWAEEEAWLFSVI